MSLKEARAIIHMKTGLRNSGRCKRITRTLIRHRETQRKSGICRVLGPINVSTVRHEGGLLMSYAKANRVFCRGADKIWQHCRDNCHSLDSERHTKVIQEEMDFVMAALKKHVDELDNTRKELNAELRSLRKTTKAQAERIERLTRTWEI